MIQQSLLVFVFYTLEYNYGSNNANVYIVYIRDREYKLKEFHLVDPYHTCSSFVLIFPSWYVCVCVCI